jgi:hypothetical protein
MHLKSCSMMTLLTRLEICYTVRCYWVCCCCWLMRLISLAIVTSLSFRTLVMSSTATTTCVILPLQWVWQLLWWPMPVPCAHCDITNATTCHVTVTLPIDLYRQSVLCTLYQLISVRRFFTCAVCYVSCHTFQSSSSLSLEIIVSSIY